MIRVIRMMVYQDDHDTNQGLVADRNRTVLGTLVIHLVIKAIIAQAHD